MRRRTLLAPALLALALTGCSDDPAAPAPPVAVGGLPLTVHAVGARLAAPEDADAELAPRVELDGQWVAPDACTLRAEVVTCTFGAAGSLALSVDGAGLVQARYQAAVPASFGGFELRAEVDLPGATAWLSNGFHSWSQSGVLALGPVPDDALAAEAAADYGDSEVFRTGELQSCWHTWVAGPDAALVAGALTARRFRSWTSVGRTAGDGVALRLVSGGVPADRAPLAAGAEVDAEAWWLRRGADLPALLTAWGDALAATRSRPAAAPELGWNSWYELWDTVDAEAVRENAALAAGVLAPLRDAEAPPLRIVIDDGWQNAWGDWTPNAKFPTGLAGLAADLRADGFEVGVWLAPLLVAADAPLAAAHPDWLVGGAVYDHAKHGAMRVLDVTHPDARAHLHDVIAGLVADGLTLLKIDFLFAGTFAGTRAEPVSAMAAYALALATIREAAGPDTVLLAVGAPAVASLPYVDAWRLGGDIALEPFGARWPWLPNQTRSLAARWPVCRALLCDADPPLLRDLAPDEVAFGLATVALAGGGLFLSDDLRDLPAERAAALTPALVAWARAGRPGPPIDLVPPDPPATLPSALTDLGAGATLHVVPTRWRPDATGAPTLLMNATDAPRRVDDAHDVPAHGITVLAP